MLQLTQKPDKDLKNMIANASGQNPYMQRKIKRMVDKAIKQYPTKREALQSTILKLEHKKTLRY